MRPSYVEVDLGAVASNVATLTELVAPAEMCTVVKADGYGHGDVPVAEAALRGGATRLAVALVEEGIRLREAGIDVPILLLSEPPADALEHVVRWRLTPTLYRPGSAHRLAAVVAGHDVAGFPVHYKVDTGMHRVGASPAEALTEIEAVTNEPALALEGVWTHFAVAEEDPDFTHEQLEVLLAVRAMVDGAGTRIPLWHAANTAGAIRHPEARLDMVRVGLGTYGLLPAPEVGAELGLRPAMRVVSHVSHVRRHEAGARPSYGRVRALAGAATVATVPIGYADGYARRLTDTGGEVLIHGRRHPLAGTVTMDQIVVDVGDDDVAVGDEVVLLGSQGPVDVTADELAHRLGTINYEIVCDWGPRLPRRYVESAT